MVIRTRASILGNMSGKIGPLILSTWCGLEVIKAVSGKRKEGKFSQELAQQNDLFKIVCNFLTKGASKHFKKGYQLRKTEHITSMNAATSYHMLHAIVGEYPAYGIDLAKVKFTRVLHPTEMGWNAQFFSEDGNLTVEWELNAFAEKTTRLDDEAFVVFYDLTFATFTIINGLQRSSLSAKFPANLTEYSVGHEIFSWLFFISANGKLVSETEYLGVIKVPE